MVGNGFDFGGFLCPTEDPIYQSSLFGTVLPHVLLEATVIQLPVLDRVFPLARPWPFHSEYMFVLQTGLSRGNSLNRHYDGVHVHLLEMLLRLAGKEDANAISRRYHWTYQARPVARANPGSSCDFREPATEGSPSIPPMRPPPKAGVSLLLLGWLQPRIGLSSSK